MKLGLLTLLMLLGLLSCGRPESKSPAFKEINPIAPEFMDQITNQQFISCDNGNCTPGIGRMFSMSTDPLRQSMNCTAILVGANLVLTNSHCAYTGRSNLINTCKSLYFSFPSPDGSVQGARCSKILWRDKRQYGQPNYRKGDNDFSLIRLDRALSITPLKFAKGGMKTGTKVYPTVMDQVDAYNARIVRLTCHVKHLSEKLGVATLMNCPIISGNSGSPVLDENQNLIGIVFASSNLRVRKPTDDMDVRRTGKSVGFAYSADYVESVLGNLLN